MNRNDILTSEQTYCESGKMFDDNPSPFTVFAILTDKISVMPVYAIQEANVPSNTYAKAVSALELNPSITQLIILTSSPELTTGKPPIRPATVRDTSMERVIH